MRYWYHTEFLENGATIELISIGIVAEDGREYYAVNADATWDRIAQHQWLSRNVMPHLGDGRVPQHVIRMQVEQFLRHAVGTDQPEAPELWGWYAAYDHIALAATVRHDGRLPGLVADADQRYPPRTATPW
ncbi:3'-5' exoribonuclease domain-containing protein [Nocardia sp. NPDC052566]|uniref:3'-5' exoribonuclease domain-containing protein n=1 Tax=Nocardia sp. NPDC052566 TaxID=3364330 RepID=UPI0037C7CE37